MPAKKMKKMNNLDGLSPYSKRETVFFVLVSLISKFNVIPLIRHIYTRIADIYKSFTIS